MKKLITVLALVLFAAAISTAVYGQDEDKPAGRKDGPVDLKAAKSSAFLTLDLAAGFPLDPFFVSINGGGDVDASTLDESCVGFVTEQPVVTLNWEGQVDFASIFFYSDHDPTLVIQMPDGAYVCNDDAHENLLDPIIRLEEPPQGEYHIWVGSLDEGNLIPGVLVVTTKDEFSVGNFSLSGFVKRARMARTPITVEQQLPEAGVLRAAFAGALEKKQDSAPVLNAQTPVITQTLVVTGMTPAFMLPVAKNSPVQLCNGLINRGGDAFFQLEESATTLNVFFQGEIDSTLVVVGPDGNAYCTDNSSDGANLNPVLSITDAQEGVYGVGIGRLDPSTPITGVLTIDISGELQPATLAPAETNP